MFANEAFSIVDRFKGGFLKGSRTSDNIFVLQAYKLNGICVSDNIIGHLLWADDLMGHCSSVKKIY